MIKYLLIALCISSIAQASQLHQACPSCPKELHIHLASGFFSTFGKKNVELYRSSEEYLSSDLLNNILKIKFEPTIVDRAFLQFTHLTGTSDLYYRVKGSFHSKETGTFFKLIDHHYYYLDENHALYQINLSRGNHLFKILGDVKNPQSNNPIFIGVLVNQENEILFALRIRGRDFESSDILLQQMERFMITFE